MPNACRHSSFTVLMPPNSMRARRRAASGDTPERTRSWVYCSMWKRSSSVRSASKSPRDVSARTSERRRANISHLLRCRAQGGGNRRRESAPARSFLTQAPPPRGGQRVVLRPPVVVALAPFGRDESLMFQPVERRIQRALRNLERVTRDLPNAQQHAVPVKRF